MPHPHLLFLAAVFAFSFVAALCAASEGALFVLNKSDATVSVIDPNTGKSSATIPVNVGPHEAATSPDGSIVVVCNYGDRATLGSTLSIIDVATNKVVREIDLKKYHRPHGIQFLPAGDRLIVTVEQERKLLIVNIKEGAVEAAIDTDQDISHMVALTPDAHFAFVANIGSGSVSIIDINTHKLIKVLETAPGAEGVAAHPIRDEVWVTNRVANTVSVINTNTLEEEVELDCGEFPIRVAFTPDGAHALVSCARTGDVVIFDANTRKELRRIKMTEKAVNEDEKSKRLFGDSFGASPVPIGILIEPDGSRAYIANTNADIITVIDLKTWKISKRLTAGAEPDGLAWSNKAQ